MARLPLHLVSWCYDDETNRVVATFQDAPAADNPDPVSFLPSQHFTVEFAPLAVDGHVKELSPLPDPAPAEGDPS